METIKSKNGVTIGVPNLSLPKGTEIFVFGSNESGIHGAGAARYAKINYGAIMGIGFGFSGTSFAIPTKDFHIETLPFDTVKKYIRAFIFQADFHPEWNYKVTRIGCGLAGFNDEEISPLFKNCGNHFSFDSFWKEWLGENKNYWGTF
jgi:hypothetical protein